MDIVSAILLGFIQGLTEWLPISSSGHLVMVQTIFGISIPPEFDIVVMIGTIAALVLYFRKKLLELLFGLLARDEKQIRYLILIVLAGIPTALIGFAGRATFKGFFGNPIIVGLFIMATGGFLILASGSKTKESGIKPLHSLLVGTAQGIAVAPGISRSGSTIGTALLLGIPAVEAAEFSFIIGIPAMTVASLLEFKDAQAIGIENSVLVAGILAAFIAGYASIGFFMRLLKERKLYWFGYYCIAAGAAFILFVLSMKSA